MKLYFKGNQQCLLNKTKCRMDDLIKKYYSLSMKMSS